MSDKTYYALMLCVLDMAFKNSKSEITKGEYLYLKDATEERLNLAELIDQR